MADSTPNQLLAAGTVAPDFTLPSGLQEKLTLSSLRGKPEILSF
jgi:peroxiredoxin